MIVYVKIAIFLSVLVCLYGCTKSPNINYKVTGIKLYNMDDTGAVPVIDSLNALPAKAYGISMHYTTRIVNTPSDTNEDSHVALAYRAVSLNIYSLTSFDSSHPAMVSLNDYFLYNASGNGLSNQVQFFSILDAVKNNFLFQTGDVQLIMMKAPDTLGYRTFVTRTQFSDNTTFLDTVSVTLY